MGVGARTCDATPTHLLMSHRRAAPLQVLFTRYRIEPAEEVALIGAALVLGYVLAPCVGVDLASHLDDLRSRSSNRSRASALWRPLGVVEPVWAATCCR
jgi:hypothetical protein